ncbi:hypothetical protein DPMN_050989 [Dreissena polymorpha]|uniref:Uncharacterized protein n=1 Tax=Dreissena polymorpha TaxID=45954 RepID=A0A9D4HNI1_DREPO|nr:hypothetical protein DPMN_050989 [Dreissena polymorpha]
MIPGRDLLIGRTTVNERSKLISKLEELITEDGRVIYRLPKLRAAVETVPPDELEQRGKRRDKLERLELTCQYRRSNQIIKKREETAMLCWNDKIYRDARYEMFDMVWPQWRDYLIAENRTETLNTVIQSIGAAGTFRDHYLIFARSNLSIVWPHLKSEVTVKEDTSEELIMEQLAILRVKEERDLS